MGGIWLIFPRKSPKTASIFLKGIPFHSLTERISPVGSSVDVSSPSFSIPSYSFRPSSRNGTSFVPSLMAIGRTPVAKGSRVPM
ncbi:MAG: hypothetical protein A2170_16870 [Deltaproteobacteria bacterium RBG_13_53_10]|nr:MAG: hypothetical protein A2170_16870 [Deltaproteobacteria bacterium RBG_13_53_10]